MVWFTLCQGGPVKQTFEFARAVYWNPILLHFVWSHISTAAKTSQNVELSSKTVVSSDKTLLPKSSQTVHEISLIRSKKCK